MSHEDYHSKPLDASFYNLKDDEIEFLSAQTGIKDPDELKKHVLAVQADVYKVYPYHCIRSFGFTKLKISRFPVYQEMLRLGRERKGALYLDLACCVGNDVRKAVADGFPIAQAIAADLQPGFWELGHKLFKSTPETFPVPFIQADVFDPACLAPSPIPTIPPTDELPPLTTLKSLTPLIGRLSAIHASAFFHLFPEDKQLQLAKVIAPLLSPEPGSIIFGAHGGLPTKGFRERKNSNGNAMFCHSPETWKKMWETQVFGPGQVEVEGFLRENPRVDANPGETFYHLVWSVTRL